MIVHESIFDQFSKRMVKAYEGIKIGDPLDPNSLVGPLHTKGQVDTFLDGIARAQS